MRSGYGHMVLDYYVERVRRIAAERRTRLAYFAALLNERNPLTILNRGYSITRDAAGKIIRDAATVALGDHISIRLARGELDATVKDKKP